jgi:hypothetical protein
MVAMSKFGFSFATKSHAAFSAKVYFKIGIVSGEFIRFMIKSDLPCLPDKPLSGRWLPPR